MKFTGVSRKLDNLGRFVLPAELRRSLNIKTGDSLMIFTDGDSIILSKKDSGCIFCGDVHGTKRIKGRNVCIKCLSFIAAFHLTSSEMSNPLK